MSASSSIQSSEQGEFSDTAELSLEKNTSGLQSCEVV